MKLYRVEWPDGEVIIVMAADEEELFVTLDEFGNPFAATIEEVEPTEPIILKSDSGPKAWIEFPYRVVRVVNEKVLDEVMEDLYVH